MFKYFVIVPKFKNYCPISVGSIDVRYDNKNPAELYPNTTWELLSSDKYIRTGSTALQTGGSNSISITKANLPNVKLKVNSFSLTTRQHKHIFYGRSDATEGSIDRITQPGGGDYNYGYRFTANTELAGGENTGSSSPYTETLGSGTALSIQPTYITLKFWKRLT